MYWIIHDAVVVEDHLCHINVEVIGHCSIEPFSVHKDSEEYKEIKEKEMFNKKHNDNNESNENLVQLVMFTDQDFEPEPQYYQLPLPGFEDDAKGENNEEDVSKK